LKTFRCSVVYHHHRHNHKQINALIINTAETTRQRFFLERFLSLDKPLLFVGATGTGKSAITNSYLLELPKDKYIINNINFSAQTSANQTQDIIFSKLDRSDFFFLQRFCDCDILNLFFGRVGVLTWTIYW
jgi:hypothetical protein